MRNLTHNQRNLLDTLKRLPRKFRHQHRAGGAILMEVFECYDWRILNGLFDRGLLRFNEFGVVVEDKSNDL